ncbi:hypothetical protein [Mucilaginibacter celer]|uniref:Uncharacterized protein n=1 Tax=Mucilaginibacter celer TaxID=2305508 RepID=A0A494VUK1_9SPHI|nr:hypothetical protein [Mucilaginibacter celer]AYL97711.1 hypothetical protein HYN43_021505 [Mucilaginibacter celer]
MSDIDNIDFILTGESFAGIKLNDPLEKVFALLGDEEEKVGVERYGFLHFEQGIRIGYLDNTVDELSILFTPKAKFSYLVRNSLNEEIAINGKTQLHEFIYLLKTKRIKWRCIDDKNMSDLMLEMNGQVLACFDLYTGYLNKIFIGRK